MSPAKSKSDKSKGKASTPGTAASNASPPSLKRSSKIPATPPKLDKMPEKQAPVPAAAPKAKVPRIKSRKLKGDTPRETRKLVKDYRRQLAVRKALKTQKKVIKSANNDRKRVRKMRTSIQFKRPRTFRPPRNPKFPRKSVPSRNRMDAVNILLYPLTSEAAMKKIEENNTLVFICNPKANKIHIRAAFTKMLDVTVLKVNTLITPKGKKKAYIKLSSDTEALDIANKIGII